MFKHTQTIRRQQPMNRLTILRGCRLRWVKIKISNSKKSTIRKYRDTLNEEKMNPKLGCLKLKKGSQIFNRQYLFGNLVSLYFILTIYTNKCMIIEKSGTICQRMWKIIEYLLFDTTIRLCLHTLCMNTCSELA